MGNSTISLQDTIDAIASRGNINPEVNPQGYNLTTCLSIANDVMDELIARRFNWKWNSNLSTPFFTNAWQQDYPQMGISSIGWLEGAWALDINSSVRPLPYAPLSVEQDLDICAFQAGGPPRRLCWAYNKQLSYGQWPGPTQTYLPLLGAATPPANGPMAFVDTNQNILTLTSFGRTGATAPNAPVGSVEGTTVEDGSCAWTVCNPNGQGFRLDSPPASGGPVWQVTAKYQATAPQFTQLTQLIDPLPDDFAHHFRRGYTAGSHEYSSDPKAQAAAPALRQAWIASMLDATQQGNREPESYMLIPASPVVAPGWGLLRDPRDPRTPY